MRRGQVVVSSMTAIPQECWVEFIPAGDGNVGLQFWLGSDGGYPLGWALFLPYEVAVVEFNEAVRCVLRGGGWKALIEERWGFRP
jgi:hypothetical protein